MAREEFINNLREASRWLFPRSEKMDSILLSTNFWLDPSLVKGFDPTDFSDLSNSEREKLEREVAAFLEVAEQVKDKPAPEALSEKARKHLDRAITIVRKPILDDWLRAQQRMLEEAKTAAKSNGWYAEQDDKEVFESLLGQYKAPRLLIRTLDHEIVFDPIARFGSGRQGVIDLVTLPKYETAYLITLKDGTWYIARANEAITRHKVFSRKSLANAISRLSHP